MTISREEFQKIIKDASSHQFDADCFEPWVPVISMNALRKVLYKHVSAIDKLIVERVKGMIEEAKVHGCNVCGDSALKYLIEEINEAENGHDMGA